MIPNPRSIFRDRTAMFSLGLACAMLLLMVDNQSLWTDEGCTAIYAVQKSPSEFLAFLKADSGGDALMPLSVASIWLWGKLFGTAEWTLRSLNLVWGVTGLIALALTGRLLRMPWLPLLMAVQPFFWHYTNEVRPYAAQLAIGSWLLFAFLRSAVQNTISKETWYVFLSATCLLSASSVLAPVLLCPLAAAVLFPRNRDFSIRKPPWIALAIATGALGLLAFYYLKTLQNGAAGTRHWSVSPINLAYVFYEIWGAASWGPSVPVLRESYFRGELLSQLPNYGLELGLIGLAGCVFLFVCLCGILSLRKQGRLRIPIKSIAVFLAVAFLFYLLGVATRKAFWARHLAPAFPFYVLFCAFAFQAAWNAPRFRQAARICCVVFLIFLAGGSLRERFHPEYKKEDVRGAAGFAREQTSLGKTVVWYSDARSAIFYGITTTKNGEANPRLIVGMDPFTEAEGVSNPPDYVIFGNRQYFREREELERRFRNLGLTEVDRLSSYIIYGQTSRTPNQP